jgi:hypothetical protein
VEIKALAVTAFGVQSDYSSGITRFIHAGPTIDSLNLTADTTTVTVDSL